MARELSAYEVRCPRCDVSFPVGTRRCMHCGGPTSDAARPQRLESIAPADYSTGYSTGYTTNYGSNASSGALPDKTGGPGTGLFELPQAAASDADLDDLEQPASIGRTLFRSFGGLIWVVLLIIFSIARHCGAQ